MSVTFNKALPFFRWPMRRSLPREASSFSSAVPALVSAVPMPSYQGRSRFVFSPLSLSFDQFLFLITAALLCFGLVMVQSADARVRGVHEDWIFLAFQNKNAIHAGIALGAMMMMWRLDYRWLIGRSLMTTPAFWMVGLTAVALLAVFVP